MQNDLNNKLTAENSLVILIDHQPGLLMNVKTMDPLTIKNNVVAFANALKVMNVPTILTYIGSGGFGPIISDLIKVLPGSEPINRTIIDVWEEPTIRDIIKKSGKKNIILGGISLDVCVSFPALSLQNAGYQVYSVLDISGCLSADIQTWAIARLVQKGIIPVSFTAVLMEMLRDNALPIAGDVYGALSASWGLPLFLSELAVK